MDFERFCRACKKNFPPKTKNHTYCSTKCFEKSRGFDQKCLNCEKIFVGRTQRKFCSSSCFGRFRIDHVRCLIKKNTKYPKIKGLNKSQVFVLFNRKAYEDNLRKDRDKRISLIQKLGGKCCACGYDKDTRALELDHVKNDGYLDRKKRGRGKIYRYYIKNVEEAVKNLQVLCSNCNKIKQIENREFLKNYKFDKSP